MIRILLTGRNGQVGWELERSLQPIGAVTAVDRNRCDLLDLDALRATLDEVRPQLIVNAAAYTAVDKAQSEPEQAFRVNAEAPGLMAEWAARHGAALVHFSTDYVFSGEGNAPYTETDTVAPLSVYGQSKLAGEQAVQSSGCPHFILRTSWVYGSRGHNFLRTILRLASERDELRIVDDQWGAPTWARSIADATACLIAAASSQGGDLSSRIQDRGGVFHLTSGGSTTWHGFARAILEHSGTAQRVRLVPIRSEEYPTPARRPGNSRLSGEKIEVNWGIRLPDWSESLRLCLADMPATGR